MTPNVVAIIQARMGSSRLPGKILGDLAGEPMLARTVRRVGRARNVHEVVVATTTEAGDDIIADLCGQHSWPVFRGSEDDVLDRYFHAARAYDADVVVRITSDCPLIDPGIIDRVVALLHGPGEFDYVSNIEPPTFPRGLDTEVMRFPALARAWRDDADPAWREHVTLFIRRHPDKFRMGSLRHAEDLSMLRWTVDTKADAAFARAVYEHFRTDAFTWTDVLAALTEHPEWAAINRGTSQKPLPP